MPAPSHYLNQCWNIVNWPLGTNFSEIVIEIYTFSFKKMHVKMSSGKWRPSRPGLMCSAKSTLTLRRRWVITFHIKNGVIIYPTQSQLTHIKYRPSGGVSVVGSKSLLLPGVPFTNIPAWISNYTHYNVWDEITYSFLNFNDCTVEVHDWISNFIPHFTGCDYLSMLGFKWNHVSKSGPRWCRQYLGRQWRQNWHHDSVRFSVLLLPDPIHPCYSPGCWSQHT